MRGGACRWAWLGNWQQHLGRAEAVYCPGFGKGRGANRCGISEGLSKLSPTQHGSSFLLPES